MRGVHAAWRYVRLTMWKVTALQENIAHEALVIFLALTSADSYKKMLSHLGPDPMVIEQTFLEYDID